MNHCEIKDGILHYDFPKCLSYLEQMGKQHYGPKFIINPEDKEIIFKLIVYFISDQENCTTHGIDLQKGILLTGPVGCGKTSLMFLMRYFAPHPIAVKPSREITFEFIREGYDTINKYGKKDTPYCFDDLGVEQSLKYYGNECNVMAEILLSRYDLFISQNIRTHATTNLNAQELEKLYGNRVRSRLRELFNLVSFDRKVEDKRR